MLTYHVLGSADLILVYTTFFKVLHLAILLFSLMKLSHYINSLFLLYNALILPFLNYCNIVWGNCNKTKINTLVLLQKRAIRICSHTNDLAHMHHSHFKRLKTLKAEDIHTFQTAIFMYKYVTNLLPPSFQNFFTYNANIHSYPTRRSTDVHLNNPRTLLAHKTI